MPRPRPANADPAPLARFAPPNLSTISMTLSVKSSQPLFECEPASPAFTVRAVLSSRTPFSAHLVRFLRNAAGPVSRQLHPAIYH